MKTLRLAARIVLCAAAVATMSMVAGSPASAAPQDNCFVIAYEPTKTGSTLEFKASVFCGGEQPILMDQIGFWVGAYKQTSPGVYKAVKWGNKVCYDAWYCSLTVTLPDPAGSQVWLTYGEAQIFDAGYGVVIKSDRSANRTF